MGVDGVLVAAVKLQSLAYKRTGHKYLPCQRTVRTRGNDVDLVKHHGLVKTVPYGVDPEGGRGVTDGDTCNKI